MLDTIFALPCRIILTVVVKTVTRVAWKFPEKRNVKNDYVVRFRDAIDKNLGTIDPT